MSAKRINREQVNEQVTEKGKDASEADAIQRLAERLAVRRASVQGLTRVTPEAADLYLGVLKSILAADEVGVPQLAGVVAYLESEEGAREWDYGLGNLAHGYRHPLRRNFTTLLPKARKWAVANQPDPDEDYDYDNPVITHELAEAIASVTGRTK